MRSPSEEVKPWWWDAWWAEPFDFADLKRRGFTRQEVRELERLRMEAVPHEVKYEGRRAVERLSQAIEDALGGALLDDDEERTA